MSAATNTPTNDTLAGGIRDDTYVWGRASGNDVLMDEGGVDILHINATTSEISLSADTDDGSLVITLSGKSLTIRDYFSVTGSGHIEKFVFANGAVWGLAEVSAALSNNPPPPPSEDRLLLGTAGDDTLKGGAGNDTLDGGAGSDVLMGGTGNDTYIWSPTSGVDFIDDISGTDVVFARVASSAATLSADTDDGSLMLKANGATLHIKDYFNALGSGHVEKIMFSDGVIWDLNKVLEILESPTPPPPPRGDHLVGTHGNDTLQGSLGHDTLNGGHGDDVLLGGKGDDVYVWGEDGGYDLVKDAGGIDTVRIGTASSNVKLLMHLDGTLVISAGKGALTIRNYLATSENGGHIEKLVFSDGVEWDLEKVLEILNGQTPPPPPDEGKVIVGDDTDEILSGTGFADTIDGAAGDDKLLGFGGDDSIAGGTGNDLLDGGTGHDLLTGGQGDDTYIWGSDSGSDFIEDSSGTDVVRIGALSSAVTLSADTDDGSLLIRLNGETLQIRNYFNEVGIPENHDLGHIEKLVFTDGTVWDLAKVLQILAGPKPDPDPEPEPEGEIIVGQRNDDILIGTMNDDTLMGGIGHDTLDGGAGNDILIGGQGKDALTGGAGEDFFSFVKKSDLGFGSKRDVIVDFEAGSDMIDFGRIDANSATKKNDAFKVLLKGKATFTKAGQLHYDAKNGILSGNTDKDASAEFQILLKNKPKSLYLDDFVL